MPSIAHTHQYIRTGSGGRIKQYMCAHPECSHVVSKKLLMGKKSICNKCMEEFILGSYELKAAKPICKKCRTTNRIEHTVDISKIKGVDIFRKPRNEGDA